MAQTNQIVMVDIACEEALRVSETGILIIMHHNGGAQEWNGHKFDAWFKMNLCCIAQTQVVRRHATVMCSRRRDHLAADA
jgi:hypothetical protein